MQGSVQTLLSPPSMPEWFTALDYAPADTTNAVAGTWRASMSAAWDTRRQQSTEGNRVAVGGTMVDCEAEGGSASFCGAFGAGDGTLFLPFVPKWMYLNETGSWSCWEHGAPPPVELVETNVPPPYIWTDGGGETESLSHVFSPKSPEFYTDGMTVYCREADATHSNLVLEASIVLTADHCPQPVTNIVGAASGSTHDPTNATDHLPGAEPDSIWRHGPSCPPTTNFLVKAGWTHNTAILWIRNLIRIITHDPWDDETDHCIGLVWHEGGSISLYDYLADCCKPYADKFTYFVNGSQCEGTLEFGAEPAEFHPTVFHVELRDEDGGETLDRMWVVVNAIKSRNNFNEWYGNNVTDTSWVATLPRPYAQLSFSTNWLWGVTAVDPEPSAPNLWNPPKPLSSFLHHDAKWEMRSPENAGGHGNQACYDANGQLNRNGISGGTADYSAGELSNFRKHVPDDVDPFLNAVHLDGNPGDTTTLNNLSRPCLYQGDNIGKYIECRPIVQPEGE